MNTTSEKTSVIIAGAGPVGLALACELGMRNVACQVLEKRDGSISQPRMSAVSARNMELCRRWGVADRVRTAVWPESYAMDFVYLTSLQGTELARQRLPSIAVRGALDFTPEGGCHCPQIYFDPILAERAAKYPSVQLRYETRLDSFEETDSGVVATITDVANDKTSKLAADYIVGCDGPGGVVRDALGIGLGEVRIVAQSVNIFFRSPELHGLHDKGWARFYRLIDNDGCWAELIPINGRELWRLTVFDDETFVKDPEAALVKAMGSSFPHETLSVTPWERRDVVADSYGRGRVVIAGDAAHQCSPTGGLGMHTGIEEAVNLGWKLGALVEGWGGANLLASYEPERRPIARRNVGIATRIFGRIRSIPGTAEEATAGWRADLEGFSITEREKMAYAYDNSPIVVPDNADGHGKPIQSGMRAPHAWLSEGRSTLDLFSTDFTLLCFDKADEARALKRAADAASMPLRVEMIEKPEVAAVYGSSLVLVRPDGHIAWHGESATDAASIIDCCRGKLDLRISVAPATS